MATVPEVQRLRRLTNEPTSTTYDDLTLSAYIDGQNGNVEAAAAEVWREKAARYATLVDTTEGSSSRKMSQLRDAALKMADSYKPGTSDGGPAEIRPRSRAIVRG